MRGRGPPLEPFRTERYSDFSRPEAAAAFELGVAGVGTQLGGHAPVLIGGVEVPTDEVTESTNPARPDQIVGTAGVADVILADRALDGAWASFEDWSRRPAAERAEIVYRVGDLMAARKYELAAWQTYEAGKNWAEAEADVAEAVDFCRYYAHQTLAMAAPMPVSEFPGETNESWLQPLGAGVVISPWNFPLAILVGMAIGPVAAGNTVVIKPASNTPMIGWQFMRIAAEAGVPAGVLNYLPGPGSLVGDRLVDNPSTRFINFTGSKEVGLRIAKRAAVVSPPQKWLKRAYLEMGGKDAIIVDETADLDRAATDIVQSAFGFQGQKCSACSRLIAVDAIHDELLDMVVGRAGALEMGPPVENYDVGPVISAAQMRSIRNEIDRGDREADLVLGGDPVDRDSGYYLEPTIFAGVAPDARLAQHEIFGPVLSVIHAVDFAEALAVANSTEFGLTGGLHSQGRDRIETAKRDFHVGNLYINRKITGALVGVQPFGGFNMSGSNAKAGGPDYLRLFMQMKSVAERL